MGSRAAKPVPAGEVTAQSVTVAQRSPMASPCGCDHDGSADGAASLRPDFGAVQRKALISSPDEPAEREADRVAARVVSGASGGQAADAGGAAAGSPPVVQRKCASCEEDERVQRQALESSAAEPAAAMPVLVDDTAHAGPGQKVPRAVTPWPAQADPGSIRSNTTLIAPR